MQLEKIPVYITQIITVYFTNHLFLQHTKARSYELNELKCFWTIFIKQIDHKKIIWLLNVSD